MESPQQPQLVVGREILTPQQCQCSINGVRPFRFLRRGPGQSDQPFRGGREVFFLEHSLRPFGTGCALESDAARVAHPSVLVAEHRVQIVDGSEARLVRRQSHPNHGLRRAPLDEWIGILQARGGDSLGAVAAMLPHNVHGRRPHPRIGVPAESPQQIRPRFRSMLLEEHQGLDAVMCSMRRAQGDPL